MPNDPSTAPPEPDLCEKTKAANGAILRATNLRKSYGGRAVVDGVCLHVHPGEIVGLLGPNGAGKTTSFYMLAGIVPPERGKVQFAGHDITHLAMHKRARLGLGYLPQEDSVFRKLSVADNLLAVLETRKDLNRRARREFAANLLERFGIAKLAKAPAITLSGGEKRRLAIARALCSDPRLIMLDEPFSGIDPIAIEDIQRLIRELRQRDGLAILITDHSVRETLGIADRAYLIHDGRVILEGPSDTLADHPLARKHYLGEEFKL
jgi:lipopolysaccharide export system ATP-binding protein